ncbi:MAG: sugar ABC transporter ATP-binding protein [Rhodothermales bacterium]
MPATPDTPLLSVRNVTKRFPGVLALDGVSLDVGHGEVLALIGENGAGKSTLMKILAGVQRPDEGEILLDGQPVVIDSCRRALDLGIALIHQELNLADNLTVAANIFLGREPQRMGLIDRKAIVAGAEEALERIGLDVSPHALVRDLAIGRQQLVEIAKALSANARVLIMDEPTSSLSAGEAEQLFEVVEDLRRRGVSVIYISHRLAEVKRLSDRVEVFRDGKNAGTLDRDAIDHEAMVQLMVGRDVSKYYARSSHTIGETVLEVTGLVTPAWPQHPLTFSVRAGEIVGISGLVGAGRTELLRVLFGVDRALGGTIRVADADTSFHSPMDAIEAGIALVPEERKEQGLVIEMTVRQNIGLAGLWRNRRRLGGLNREQEIADTAAMIDQLGIKTPSQTQIARFLSGGNQQKVVLGKWLTMGPRLLLLDEPTRGIDVGAKEEVYRLMEKLAREGLAILFVSSELEEILGMSDRVLVMHEGRITGELSRNELSEEAVMHLATGATNRE